MTQSGTTVQRLDVLEAPAAGNAPNAAHDAVAGAAAGHPARRSSCGAQFDKEPAQEYDSTNGLVAPAVFAQVAGLVGEPMVDLTLTAGGEVTAAASHLPGRDGSEVDASVYRDLFPRLPADPVAAGESWEDVVTTKVQTGETARPWKLRRKFTLTGVEDGVATIAVKVTPMPPPVDTKVRTQLAGRCPRGTVTFDISRGAMLTQTATVDDQIVNFQGVGTLLHLVQTHDQRLTDSGPTAEMKASDPGKASRVAVAGGADAD